MIIQLSMSLRQKINSNDEPECFGAKIGSRQWIHAPVRGTTLPISLLGAALKAKIAQKRERKFDLMEEEL